VYNLTYSALRHGASANRSEFCVLVMMGSDFQFPQWWRQLWGKGLKPSSFAAAPPEFLCKVITLFQGVN